MNELVKLAKISGPLWFRSLDGNGEELNLEEYARSSPLCIGVKPANFTAEATKATGTVMINSQGLVETLMDTSQWVDCALLCSVCAHKGSLSSFNCPMPAGVGNFGFELAVGRNDFGATNSVDTALPAGLDFGNGISSVATSVISSRPTPNMTGMDVSFDKTMLIELAFAAMNELVKLAEIIGPLWFRSLDGNGEELNLEEYARSSPPYIGVKPANFTAEATKATGLPSEIEFQLVEFTSKGTILA
ncbi:hypothetical protein CQW23_00082 [Capsicum baccatum]|uniref:START domain-containing protein n=1 Tax=Capsicum baccatum TaxID=33114 RepID=A0A2G2XJS8_CAPBA|nr:hypothetical protein CQW23_00082 [Capsicum baccatum]